MEIFAGMKEWEKVLFGGSYLWNGVMFGQVFGLPLNGRFWEREGFLHNNSLFLFDEP